MYRKLFELGLICLSKPLNTDFQQPEKDTNQLPSSRPSFKKTTKC